MWHSGLHTDMHVTVQDMLRLVQVARLELTVAAAGSRSIEHWAQLKIERLTASSE